MRTDIAFDAEGTILRGWLYRPEQEKAPFPLVVMTHGWAAVKEMYLDSYAEAFAQAGIATLVYDHRNFGASDGTRGQEIDPWALVRDYRHAITFAATLPDIARKRIGVWGTSYSGGHAIVVSALDKRVSCVVVQAPTISGWRNTLRRFPGDTLVGLRKRFDADREARSQGKTPAMVPVIADFNAADVGIQTSSPSNIVERIGNDARKWPLTMPQERLEGWRNEITLRSVELYSEYEPGVYIERIAPTPFLLISATEDTITPTDEILAAYARAYEPKQIMLVPGGHYDLYGINREGVITTTREMVHQVPEARSVVTTGQKREKRPRYLLHSLFGESEWGSFFRLGSGMYAHQICVEQRKRCKKCRVPFRSMVCPKLTVISSTLIEPLRMQVIETEEHLRIWMD